jgi:hypothetical protein
MKSVEKKRFPDAIRAKNTSTLGKKFVKFGQSEGKNCGQTLTQCLNNANTLKTARKKCVTTLAGLT